MLLKRKPQVGQSCRARGLTELTELSVPVFHNHQVHPHKVNPETLFPALRLLCYATFLVLKRPDELLQIPPFGCSLRLQFVFLCVCVFFLYSQICCAVFLCIALVKKQQLEMVGFRLSSCTGVPGFLSIRYLRLNKWLQVKN